MSIGKRWNHQLRSFEVCDTSIICRHAIGLLHRAFVLESPAEACTGAFVLESPAEACTGTTVDRNDTGKAAAGSPERV